MSSELNAFLQLTYLNALRTQRDTAAAFERTVQVMLKRRPGVSAEEAWQEVGRALAVELPARD
jgi:hypothetical protein